MKIVILLLVAALIILHQDFWFWDTYELAFGFMPIGLLYHMALTVFASFVWLFICTFGWPEGIDDFGEEDSESNTSTEGGQA